MRSNVVLKKDRQPIDIRHLAKYNTDYTLNGHDINIRVRCEDGRNDLSKRV